MSRKFPHFPRNLGLETFCSCKLRILDTHPSQDSCSGSTSVRVEKSAKTESDVQHGGKPAGSTLNEVKTLEIMSALQQTPESGD